MQYINRFIQFAILFLLPSLTLAHAGHLAHPHDNWNAWLLGLMHPLTGLDHLLVALAIGILAVTYDHKTINIKLPLSFLGFMSIGIIIGKNNWLINYYELGITLSVLLLGICFIINYKLATWQMYLFLTCFGLFHGQAHGTEICQNLNWYTFSGLILATIAIHGLGIISLLKLKLVLSAKKIIWLLRGFGLSLISFVFI